MALNSDAIDPADHLAWLVEQVQPLAPVTVRLRDGWSGAHGAVLAQDVLAAHPLPLWDNSAMDGYAVRSEDTVHAPVELQVVGVVPAGSSLDPELRPGQCVRIMTGAPIPSSADAVVRVEDTSGFSDTTVTIRRAVAPGKDLRTRGEDRAAGEPMAYAGQALTATRLSALAASGAAELRVRTVPRVAVLITGAELRVPGEPLLRGQIPESNSLLIAGLLAEAGIQPRTVRHCADDPAEVTGQLAQLSAEHDAIISTGGVGPGEYDVMRQVLQAEPQVRAVRVNLRPGTPQCAGRLRAGPLMFALPGNPVSAAVSFEWFVLPALRAMQASTQLTRMRLQAVATVGWKSPRERMQVIPVVFETVDQLRCIPAVHASSISHSVGGFGSAQGYAVVPAGVQQINPGDTVQVIRLIP